MEKATIGPLRTTAGHKRRNASHSDTACSALTSSSGYCGQFTRVADDYQSLRKKKRKKSIQCVMDQLQRASEGPTGSGTSPLRCLVPFQKPSTAVAMTSFFPLPFPSPPPNKRGGNRSPCRSAKSLLNTATRRDKKKLSRSSCVYLERLSPGRVVQPMRLSDELVMMELCDWFVDSGLIRGVIA